MTEIRKNGFWQKFDIYKRNFRHNLAKNGHINFEDLGKSDWANFRIFCKGHTGHQNLEKMSKKI